MKKRFEEDHIGFKTLDNISDADQLNGWMFSTIRPYCSGHVLEVGSGIGNISRFLLEQPYTVTVSDFRESYCERLRNAFNGNPRLAGVVRMDLVDPSFARTFSAFLGNFDTIIALNVIEHIKDDVTAIRNLRDLLKPGGRLIVLVPAFQFLYNRFDYNLGHYRRYRVPRIRELIRDQGFVIQRSRYFNALGMAGWFVSGTLLRNSSIPKGHVWLYNKIIVLSRLIDQLVFHRIGLSAICVGVKP
jgi:SAM-dependent methyltransferase